MMVVACRGERIGRLDSSSMSGGGIWNMDGMYCGWQDVKRVSGLKKMVQGYVINVKSSSVRGAVSQ